MFNRKTALDEVQKMCSHEPCSAVFVDHGHDNLIVVAGKERVFRFPRNAHAAKRLRYEIDLLQYLEGKIFSAPIAQVIAVSDHPFYAIMRYYSGIHLDYDEIQHLSVAAQKSIGEHLGEFVAEFSQVVSSTEILKMQNHTGVTGVRQTWRDYFQKVFFDHELPDERLRPIIERYYHQWRTNIEHEDASFAIHDDLHPSNVLFADGRVSAILDFADATVGSIEEEMRGVYRMGDVVVAAAIERYQQITGRAIDIEHVRVWTIMNDLVRFTRYLQEGLPMHPMCLLAKENLQRWLPEFPL